MSHLLCSLKSQKTIFPHAPSSVYRAESTGNTFLLCDSLKHTQIESIHLKELHALLLQEERDDVLILWNEQKERDQLSAHFLILGGDGQFGEFCGNGTRAAAAYLYARYPESKQFTLKTSKGSYHLKQLGNENYSALLSFPTKTWNPTFISDWTRFQKEYPELVYIEAIEPHLTFHQNLKDKELLALGRELNEKKDLFPLGINLNAWQQTGKKTLEVKTYERGVQRLTLSCGTGSIACTAHAELTGIISVKTPGGQLQIAWSADGVELSGSSSVENTPLKIYR